jgi:predicted Zn finger-like uncharacterized protein
MALAARCPQCGTSFRVVSDQLKLKGGLVRCGECRQVFDALAHLNAVDEPAASTSVPREAALPAAPVAPDRAQDSRGERSERLPRTRAAATPGSASGAADRAVDASSAAEAPPTEPLPRSAPPAERQQHAEVEPEFLRPRPARRLAAVGWSIATVVLVALLLIQLALLLRSELVGRWPALRPALEELCRYAHCTVQWPRRPELLALIGTDLEALPGTDAFEFSGTLRNRAEFTVAAPAIELTLAAADGRVVARKVWLPQQLYDDVGSGIEAGGELEFRIGFAAPDVKPASFVAYPLYAD